MSVGKGAGISEDIITALGRFRWFFVIGRNSSFVYKDKSIDPKQVARELGVQYLLEGSVRKSGQAVRISARLVDATTGAQIWAERYDLAVTDHSGRDRRASCRRNRARTAQDGVESRGGKTHRQHDGLGPRPPRNL